ncbi:LysR family transcriptional regulator [Vreelandella sp. EE27]
MDLYHSMEVFVAVVESGSMTAAGDRCGLSTTMVGNHLRALEKRLGVSLLRRTTRRQSLTEFGAVYYQRCVDILALVADSERQAEASQAIPKGTLKITAPPTFGAECLMPRLAPFMARYPEIKLDVALTDRVIDLVEERFDAAFRLGTLETSDTLVARPLMNYGLTLCASPTYLQRQGAPQTPCELAHHDCLAFAYPPGTEWQWAEKKWQFHGPEGEVTVEFLSRIEVNHAQGLRQAALAGIGIAMLPNVQISEDIRAGRLIPLLAHYSLPQRPMHLLYHQDHYRSPKLRSFIDFAVEALGS